MKTPSDKTIAFSYYSHPAENLRWRWQMTLTFPPGATGETLLSIAVVDGTGEAIPDGTMELAGHRVEIVRGRGTLSFADFVRGKHERGIWLYRTGLPPVPGALTFA